MANEIPWFPPVAAGKTFVIPDKGEYGYQRCHDPIHIFEKRPAYCKCGVFYWREEPQGSRVVFPV